MPLAAVRGITWAALATGTLLMVIFAALLLRSRVELRDELYRRMIERDAAVLHPFALQQIENEAESRANVPAKVSLAALLRHARQEGMLAMAIFDANGATVESVPASQLFVELPPEDYFHLIDGPPISRYHPQFHLDRLFTGVSKVDRITPVLEILLPLRRKGQTAVLGFVRYYLDGRPLAKELAIIDGRLRRHTVIITIIGCTLIAAVVSVAAIGLSRSQRALAERNERLIRANFELSLSAKASAIGQITSHLIHGLQGPVAGLRAAVAGGAPADWEHAAAYTERMQTLIRETVELLGDERAHATYELNGAELAATILRRGQPLARERAVALSVKTDGIDHLDSHRGSLLCLIAANLVHNSIEATEDGGTVSVTLLKTGGDLTLTVTDQGSGLSPEIQERLFQPGRTTKASGSGLGLAISHLLARQIGGELQLVQTGPRGTVFALSIPLELA